MGRTAAIQGPFSSWAHPSPPSNRSVALTSVHFKAGLQLSSQNLLRVTHLSQPFGFPLQTLRDNHPKTRLQRGR